jgi:hypothetical protein
MAIEQKYGKLNIPGIPDNEPIFIFRAQDVFAGHVLDYYAQLRNGAGDIKGTNAVYNVANDFRQWPTKKIPD